MTEFASLEPLGLDRIKTIAGQLSSTCMAWRFTLTPEEQDTPEAIAVLSGMFNAIGFEEGLTAEQRRDCYHLTLEAAAEQKSYPQAALGVPPDELLSRMLVLADPPRSLPWACYAMRETTNMMRVTRDHEVIFKILRAVKAGTFDDPAAHIMASSLLAMGGADPEQFTAILQTGAAAIEQIDAKSRAAAATAKKRPSFLGRLFRRG